MLDCYLLRRQISLSFFVYFPILLQSIWFRWNRGSLQWCKNDTEISWVNPHHRRKTSKTCILTKVLSFSFHFSQTVVDYHIILSYKTSFYVKVNKPSKHVQWWICLRHCLRRMMTYWICLKYWLLVRDEFTTLLSIDYKVDLWREHQYLQMQKYTLLLKVFFFAVVRN